jgi:hypothetical protein
MSGYNRIGKEHVEIQLSQSRVCWDITCLRVEYVGIQLSQSRVMSGYNCLRVEYIGIQLSQSRVCWDTVMRS